MKLVADVQTVNRLLPSANIRSAGKAARTRLSIGKKSGNHSDVLLMLCTQQDRTGSTFKLHNNIEHIFSKFVNEGKMTIRFKQPPLDVCISKADVVQLKGFLSVLNLGSKGGDITTVTLSSLAPASCKQVASLKTKMVINSRRDYPITTGFPSSLEILQINECALKCVDSRILSLRHLTSLDLSHNNIRSLPESWSTMICLSELNLNTNQIDAIPKSFCSGHLQQTLHHLDISSNHFAQLPPWFCNLTALTTLKLNENALICLPSGISCLLNLGYLTVHKNKLKTVPGGFAQLRLKHLDLSDNELLEDGPQSAILNIHVPLTLLETAARCIRANKVEYSGESVGHLADYLDKAKPCLCGGYSFTSNVKYLARLDLRTIAETFASIGSTGYRIPCEGFLCSENCYAVYRASPEATVWSTSRLQSVLSSK